MKEWKLGDSNKSAVFILPFLGESRLEYFGRNLPQSQFVNCFIGDATNLIDNKILLLYRFSANKVYLDFEEFLTKHKLFVKSYEVDKKHTMFVFNVPDDKIEEYNLLINGKYSKISQESKLHILKFQGITLESTTGGILFKAAKIKESLEEKINLGLPKSEWTRIPNNAELDSVFDPEIEYYQDKYKIKDAISPSSDFNI